MRVGEKVHKVFRFFGGDVGVLSFFIISAGQRLKNTPTLTFTTWGYCGDVGIKG
mgnify:CR=1 FL=1